MGFRNSLLAGAWHTLQHRPPRPDAEGIALDTLHLVGLILYIPAFLSDTLTLLQVMMVSQLFTS